MVFVRTSNFKLKSDFTILYNFSDREFVRRSKVSSGLRHPLRSQSQLPYPGRAYQSLGHPDNRSTRKRSAKIQGKAILIFKSF